MAVHENPGSRHGEGTNEGSFTPGSDCSVSLDDMVDRYTVPSHGCACSIALVDYFCDDADDAQNNLRRQGSLEFASGDGICGVMWRTDLCEGHVMHMR